jgi:hypothetical protein
VNLNQIIDLGKFGASIKSDEKGNSDPARWVTVKQVMKFDAPSIQQHATNFGLYASEDLKLFTFYYKDSLKNI